MTTANNSWLGFAMLCDILTGTRSKRTKRTAIAEYLRSTDAQSAGLAAQYLTGAVFPESDNRKIQIGGQLVVRALQDITHTTPELVHATYRKYGDLGSAAEELLLTTASAPKPLSLVEIATQIDALAVARTQAAKSAQFADLLRRLSPLEAKYLIKLVLDDMRTGVKQSLVEEAIAVAAQEDLAVVRTAEMMLGNLPAVVNLAWTHTLHTARFQMFHPLGFMLATPAANAEDAFARFAGAQAPDRTLAAKKSLAQIEDKYDGMRAQIHCGDPKQPGRVRIFSRTREDVTASFPELAGWFAPVAQPAILDGEVLAWDFEREEALPFTALQQRLGRKRVTAAMQKETPIIYMAFDLLLLGDRLLLNEPLRARRTMLEKWVEDASAKVEICPATLQNLVPQPALFTDPIAIGEPLQSRLRLASAVQLTSAAQIENAFSAAQSRGNEGLMLKAPDSLYEPGRRGGAWVKVKRELATLDVVVTAVEYGHGRRANVLSDYTFAVRDGDSLPNVGKAYSGLTDLEIQELTQWFLEHALDTKNGLILVEPKIVLEVAFNNVMQSDRHNSGYSLRFPRIMRIRPDKPVEEIDTIERVAESFQLQNARYRRERNVLQK